MAHFAELDSNNKVLKVIVVNNSELLVNGVENEQKGIDFCKSLFGLNTNWIQTSYNNNFRKQFAGVGYKYDAEKDILVVSNDPKFGRFSLARCGGKPPWKPSYYCLICNQPLFENEYYLYQRRI